MAILSPSSMMHGASGKIGGLVFRQSGGRTIVQGYSSPRGARSELQKVFNDKMRSASSNAKAALRDPAIKAHYERKKKKLKVSSAYTAACADFLRHGRLDEIKAAKGGRGPRECKEVHGRRSTVHSNAGNSGENQRKNDGEMLFMVEERGDERMHVDKQVALDSKGMPVVTFARDVPD